MALIKNLSNAISVSGDWILRIQTNDYSLKATLIYANVISDNSLVNNYVEAFEAEKEQIISIVPSEYVASISASSIQVESQI